ncbi:DUF397 domain-containing protein [Actinomadura sp. J1-007]|uniref:DUF397 domain-containing protein n=1 Tax=Actinomadura sp. J1-007 TaxID=2661913 RepID=UPI001323B10A|nr:DUF397 domain-containing protein [Actinomadura sp. J1-007]
MAYQLAQPANGACVEIASIPGSVVVRDGKAPAGPCCPSHSPWRGFVERVKSGTYDL